MSRCWLLFAVVGCVGQGKDPDGTDPDATSETDDPISTETGTPPDTEAPTETGTATDTGTPPAPTPETVRVVAYPEQAPMIGVRVLVSDADGEIVGLHVTDQAGEVRADVPAGGSVSFAETYGGAHYLETVFDIPEGATVQFVSYRFAPGGSSSSTGPFHEIRATAVASPPEVSRWTFYTRCDGGSTITPGPWTFDNARCTDWTTDQVFVLGRDAQDQIVAWGGAFDLPLIDDIDVEVRVTETAMVEVDFEATGLPGNASSVSFTLSPSHEGWRTWSPSWSKEQGIGPAESATLAAPALPYDRYFVRATVAVGEVASCGVATVSQSAPAAQSFDLTPHALVAVDPVDLSHPEQPGVTWVTTAGTRGISGWTYLSWSEGDEWHGWSTRFEPSSRSDVRMPRLPPELVEYEFQPDTVAPVSVQFDTLDFVADYADLLARPGEYPDAYEWTWCNGVGGDYLEF